MKCKLIHKNISVALVEFAEILKTSEQMDAERKSTLCKTLNARVEMLKGVINQTVKL